MSFAQVLFVSLGSGTVAALVFLALHHVLAAPVANDLLGGQLPPRDPPRA